LKFAHAFTVIACCIAALSAAAQEAPPDQAAEKVESERNKNHETDKTHRNLTP